MKHGILIIIFLIGSRMAYAADIEQNIGEWKVYTDPAQINNLSVILFSFKGETAALGIRCQNNELDVYIMFSDQINIDSSADLMMSLDGQHYLMDKWQRSIDKRGVFATDPIAVINQIQHQKKMVVTYKNERQLHKIVAFRLFGLELLSLQITKNCTAISPQ